MKNNNQQHFYFIKCVNPYISFMLLVAILDSGGHIEIIKIVYSSLV